jgi:hypothetical protein
VVESFFLGIATSFAAWALVTLLLLPRVRISPLNRRVDGTVPSGERIRLKIQNRSRFFAVGDLELHARLVLVGLDPAHPRNSTSLAVPVGGSSVFPVLDRRDRSAHANHERVYTVRLGEMHGGGLRHVPSFILEKLEAGTLTLEDVMACSPAAYLRVAVACAHGTSGIRRTTSLRFSVAMTGEFRTGSVEIFAPDDLIPR